MLIKAIAAVSIALAAGAAQGQTSPDLQIAITIDDIPAHNVLPVGGSRIDIARLIIKALKRARAPAHGFINAGVEANDSRSEVVLRKWRAAGFAVGNHGYGHPDLDVIGPAAFTADLLRNEIALAPYMQPDHQRWFRYPFLSEGRDPVAMSSIRKVLAARAYRIAAVTMDFGDYAWNSAFARCKIKGDKRAIETLERRFLAAARTDALRARALSRVVNGSDIPYVLLLHLGAFDARMMPRLLALYRQMGFRFVTLEQAQASPFYASANDPSLPGPSPRLDTAAHAVGAAIPPRAELPDGVCVG